jgi:hypothetical protein
MKNSLKEGNGSKNIPAKIQKSFLKGRIPGLFFKFGQFTCSWIRIRISNMDSEPGNSLRIRIYTLPSQKKTSIKDLNKFCLPFFYIIYYIFVLFKGVLRCSPTASADQPAMASRGRRDFSIDDAFEESEEDRVSYCMTGDTGLPF